MAREHNHGKRCRDCGAGCDGLAEFADLRHRCYDCASRATPDLVTPICGEGALRHCEHAPSCDTRYFWRFENALMALEACIPLRERPEVYAELAQAARAKIAAGRE